MHGQQNVKILLFVRLIKNGFSLHSSGHIKRKNETVKKFLRDYLSLFKSSLSCPSVLYTTTEPVTSNVKTSNGICAEMTATKEN